jgi:carboxyl-terminal processing protease
MVEPMIAIQSFSSPKNQRVTMHAFLSMLLCVVAMVPAIRAEDELDDPTPKVAPKNQEEELPVAVLTEELFKQIAASKPDQVWEPAARLIRLARLNGDAVIDRLTKEMASPDQKVQMVCARALCQIDHTEAAGAVLVRLAQSAKDLQIRRLSANAIGLTTSLYGDDTTATALSAALKLETDELTKISLARSLWRIASKNEGHDELLKMLNNSASKEVKDEAAVVLAENGFLHLTEVRVRLLNLYSEPTQQGERAFNLLRHYEEDSTKSKDSKLVQGEQLVREILRTIKNAYPDESKWNLDKLFEDAAKGMVNGLDPFSQYMDREEVKATQEMLQQDYGGIGAYVGMRNGQFIITSPIYGSPADRAGLRALDVIQEVDGEKTGDMVDKGGINGVIAKLKGAPKTNVRLKYYRRGFLKPVEVSIMRERIKVESVLHTMLPGGIGYVRLTRFGERSTEEMENALAILKKENAKAIVFDLRDNPGGLLRVGVEIADKFLKGNKLIVYSEGNIDFAPRKDYFSTGGDDDEAVPMVCLVGPGSASASEIVAGALQDHKRATLIGEKTFGKGSVQQIMPIKATERQTQLRLTIAKYYLPSGRCIHEKGVDVDVEVKPSELHGWTVEKLVELRRQNVFEDYVRNTWDANKEKYMKLAICDESNCDNWPGFNEFYKGLNTKLEPNDVRAELRNNVRRRVQDELKKELVVDLEDDDVLQRGVLEALNKLNVDPGTIAEYKTLPEKFKKKDLEHQEGAMLPEEPKKTN